MAKSIRSKVTRKLRAIKREKIAAKERLKLIALKAQEDEIKMVEDVTNSTEGNVRVNGDAMDVVSEMQAGVNSKKKKRKKSVSNSSKNVKRRRKNKRNKYKW